MIYGYEEFLTVKTALIFTKHKKRKTLSFNKNADRDYRNHFNSDFVKRIIP